MKNIIKRHIVRKIKSKNHFLTLNIEKIRQSKRGKNESAVVDEGDE